MAEASHPVLPAGDAATEYTRRHEIPNAKTPEAWRQVQEVAYRTESDILDYLKAVVHQFDFDTPSEVWYRTERGSASMPTGPHEEKRPSNR